MSWYSDTDAWVLARPADPVVGGTETASCQIKSEQQCLGPDILQSPIDRSALFTKIEQHESDKIS